MSFMIIETISEAEVRIIMRNRKITALCGINKQNMVESFAMQGYNEFENYESFKFSNGGIQHDSKDSNCG